MAIVCFTDKIDNEREEKLKNTVPSIANGKLEIMSQKAWKKKFAVIESFFTINEKCHQATTHVTQWL